MFVATENFTVPGPAPFALSTIDNQLASDCAVHVQPLPVATSTEPEPPEAAIANDERDSVTLQEGAVGEFL
jgi:hypothetical protein